LKIRNSKDGNQPDWDKRRNTDREDREISTYKRDKMEREKKRDSLLQLKANQTNKKQISLSEIHWPLQKLTLSENKTSSGENPAKTQDPFIGNYVNSGYDLPMLEEKGLKMLEMYCEKFRC
jgi:hypothetical protein